MRQFIVAAIVIFSFVIAGWSQAYYEASGQSAVFTLTAGAKVGPAAIKGVSGVHTALNNGIRVTTSRGCIVITLPVLQRGLADIAFYDIKGRQIYRQRGFSGTSLRLETKAFAPGIYSMLVRVDGQNFTRRVAVNGWGR